MNRDHAALLTLCTLALAACPPVVDEQVIPVDTTVALEPVTRVAVLVLFDDDPDLLHHGRTLKGTAGVTSVIEYGETLDGKQPTAIVDRLAVASTYLGEDGRADPFGDGVVEIPSPEEGSVNRFFDAQLEVIDDQRTERENQGEPTPRAVLTDILTDPAFSELTGDAEGPRHLFVYLSTAFDDASSTGPDALDASEEALTSTPAGVVVGVYRPLGARCEDVRGPYSLDDESHLLTEDILGDRLLELDDLCNYESGPWDAFRAHHGWTNELRLTLDGPPIDDSLQVFGVAGDTEVPLPASGWELDGPELYVKPPLMGFGAVRVVYEYEVDD